MSNPPRSLSLLQRLLVWPALVGVRLYQATFSRIMPNICRFHPTCSRYAREALETRGLFVGGALSVWRVLRCNPFSRGGDDPVPR